MLHGFRYEAGRRPPHRGRRPVRTVTATAAAAAAAAVLLLLLLPRAGGRVRAVLRGVALALPLGEHDGVCRQDVDGAITRELRRWAGEWAGGPVAEWWWGWWVDGWMGGVSREVGG
jgi:hypothetical protein